jgi:flagellar biosynthesis protein FlhG
MIDQAESLRQMVMKAKGMQSDDAKGYVKIYSVVSGKGGVGKTNVSVNLAICMAQMGKKVLVLDADIGMTNADILMGIKYDYDLFDHIEEGLDLKDIIYEGPGGIKVISGGAGLLKMETFSRDKQHKFIDQLMNLGQFDVLIIDNGAGISRESLSFITFAHEVIMVTTPEPTAITDAYRVLKAISFYELKPSAKVIINKVNDMSSGDEAFEKLYTTSKEFLNIDIENCGYIFDDSRVEKAIMEQIPVVISHPNSLAGRNIKNIAAGMIEENSYKKNISTIQQLSNRFIKIFGS